MRIRNIKSVKDELVKKSREAMLAAVQIYNNPQITFKSEAYITLAIIAWTYLMHAYYRSKAIDYRYYHVKNSRKRYDKTKNGAHKHWELERCMNCADCPLDESTQNNLRFLIGLRHEVEHQMTNNIDEFLSAKLQACALNYDYYLSLLFGEKYRVSNELALAIQFSAISPEQEHMLTDDTRLNKNIGNFISSFEDELTEEALANQRYAYRVLYVPISANRKGQADKVIEFVKSDSPIAETLGKHYTLVKETEKAKYLPSRVVEIIKSEGYPRFSISRHTELWQSKDAKNAKHQYGVMIAKTWYWYDKWLTFVREYCSNNKDKYQ